MAGYISTLKDENKINEIYPRTKLKALSDDNNNSLDSELAASDINALKNGKIAGMVQDIQDNADAITSLSGEVNSIISYHPLEDWHSFSSLHSSITIGSYCRCQVTGTSAEIYINISATASVGGWNDLFQINSPNLANYLPIGETLVTLSSVGGNGALSIYCTGNNWKFGSIDNMPTGAYIGRVSIKLRPNPTP